MCHYLLSFNIKIYETCGLVLLLSLKNTILEARPVVPKPFQLVAHLIYWANGHGYPLGITPYIA